MPGKRILIADYDKAGLAALQEFFESRDFEVLTAADGQAAYNLYKEEAPDILIIEAMLPKLHGFDLTARVYEETKGAIPVIIVTNLYKGVQYRNEALRSFGAAGYFEKPLDNEQLIQAVKKLIREDKEIADDLPSPKAVFAALERELKKGE
jgi:DNA-binding response OmpR family regulator